MRFNQCKAPFMVSLLSVCLLAAPASAAPAGPIKQVGAQAQFGDSAPVIQVQRGGGGAQGGQPPGPGVRRDRGQGGGGHVRSGGGGGGRHYGGGGYRGGYHDRGDDGAGVAAGVLGGLLLGAIIANESQRGACSRRPGYDPRSRTYVGPDRRRYRCP